MSNELVPAPSVELVRASNVPNLLQQIRPQWQAKSLIERVRRLIDVDPSSACQRLFNAAIHDLREKIIIAGVDIASEAAKQHKLPPITCQEDVEEYSTAKTITLAYRIGLLSRPEWRRITRCYDIRKDLEHEDAEYEAGVEDCVYIFSTCIEVILSKDPIQLVRVTDFKEIIEQAAAALPDETILEDFESAPQTRQEEILKFLVSNALDKEKSDVIQQNAYVCISYLNPLTHQSVLVRIGEHLQKKAGRKIDTRMARVAQAAGVFPYLRQTARNTFFESVFNHMKNVGTHWTAHDNHGDLLRSFIEYGGFESCPEEMRKKILKWLVLTFVGEPGGQTRFGNIRHVFYSNAAAPLIKEIISKDADIVREELRNLKKDKEIRSALRTEHIVRRYETLLDIVEDTST